MSEPKLDDLVIFAKVAEQKNFSKVASQLGIVKSMISKRISRLENDLGVQLINRSTRSMSLTESGHTLYEYASRIEEEFSGAMQAIAVKTDKPRGLLKVLAPLSFGNYALSKITSRFLQQYPDISVELLLSSSYHDLIDAGIDLAIHVGEPTDSNLMSRRLTSRKPAVCASPEYFMRMGTPQKPDDLQKHNCLIHSRLPESNVWEFVEKGRKKKVKVKGSFISNSSQALKNAAISGLGVVMLPRYSLSSELTDGKLVEIFSDYCAADIQVYGLYPYTKHVAPKLRAYIDFLVDEFNE